MPNTQILHSDIHRLISGRFEELSPGQKKVAHYIIREPKQVVLMSAKKLGAAVGVSEATVHRLAQVLGFETYASMKNELLQDRPVRRLMQSVHADEQSWLDRHYMIEFGNIRETSQLPQEKELDEAARLLLEADRIYVAGWRIGLAITAPLGYILQYAHGNAEIIPQGNAAEYAARFTAADVLCVTGYPRYCRVSKILAEQAVEAGARVIALTDSPMSPFAKLAHIPLFASTRSAGFLDSYVGPLAIMNALITRLAQLDTNRVKMSILQMEKQFRLFDTEYSWN